jgi:hypothetical protein
MTSVFSRKYGVSAYATSQTPYRRRRRRTTTPKTLRRKSRRRWTRLNPRRNQSARRKSLRSRKSLTLLKLTSLTSPNRDLRSSVTLKDSMSTSLQIELRSEGRNNVSS